MTSAITSISAFQYVEQTLTSVGEGLRIIISDLLPSNLTCVIPNALTWAYRTLWSGTISSLTLHNTAGKTAHLFKHGDIFPHMDGSVSALLILHGEKSHPLTMLHIADMALAEGRAVFSISLSYDDLNPENHRSLLRQSIDKIDALIAAKGGRLSKLKLLGHSRGALEAANEAYVANNPKVNDGVTAIAGRFKVIDPSTRPCRETFKPSVNAVWEKLRDRQPLRVPFDQIAGKRDWCTDPWASIVREDQRFLYVDAAHLDVIKHPDTMSQLKKWMKPS